MSTDAVVNYNLERQIQSYLEGESQASLNARPPTITNVSLSNTQCRLNKLTRQLYQQEP